MTSNFTNIVVSDSVISDTVTTDTLNCNTLAINTTNFGVSGSGLFNTIIPYNGLSTTLGASNVIVSGNVSINGNIVAPLSGTINIVKLRAYQDSELAYNNINNKVKVRNVGGSSYINFYQNGNTTAEVINGYIECTGFGADANIAWGSDLSFGASNIDIGIPVFSRFVRLYGYENQINGNLSVSNQSTFIGNANVVGNLRVNSLSNFIGNTTFNGALNTFTSNILVGNIITTRGLFNGILTANSNVVMNGNLSLIGNVLTDLDCNANLITLGNLVVNSTGNISNALTIRSGFKGATATNKFITYDIPLNGTHYFFDNIESTGSLLVNGGANIVGNITATTIGTIHRFNAIDTDEYYYYGSRTTWAYGSFGVTTTLASAGFVQFWLLQSSGLSTGSGWLKLNTTTFSSPKFLEFNFNIDITSALALTSASFSLTTADNSAFTGATTRATTRFGRSYGTNEDIQITLGFYIPDKLSGPAEDYIRITYTGSASLVYSSATSVPSNTWWTLKQIY